MAKLSQLLKEAGMSQSFGTLSIDVSGIEYNSKKIKKGSIFVAIKGFKRDGAVFIDEAIKKGAVGVVMEEGTEKENQYVKSLMVNKNSGAITAMPVKDSRKALAALSSVFYGNPSRKLNVIGITGTNGKTTVAYLVESILQFAGRKTGVIGTINYRFGGKVTPAMQTTPESLDLQRMFHEMAKNNVDSCILEVSSHSLALNRVCKTNFEVGVFTNLTQDHLDFHNNKEDYFKAKEKLFTEYTLKKAVINIDDPYGKLIAKGTSAEVMTVSTKEKGDIEANNVDMSVDGLQFTAKTPAGEIEISSSLIGFHNVYNILCAIGAAVAINISPDDIKGGLHSLKDVPGRFEKIGESRDFTVVVDYAHTEDALFNVIKAARELTDKRIITVFGCGGDRDRDKRAKMGEIAGSYSDYTIITSDNPRNEEPYLIASEIEVGIRKTPGNRKYCLIIDRKEAIEHAINMAEKGDFVLIAGKGHENYQLFKESRIDFDDREVVREIIKKKNRNR